MKGKKKSKLFFFVGSLLGVFLVAWFLNRPAGKKVFSKDSEPQLWVISDNHFFAKNLHDNGKAFQDFNQTTVGKDILYSEDLLEAFVKKALEEKPDGIVITGDTTLNGEKESLKKMAEIFTPLKKAKIPIFGIPGNHDIHDGWARKFVGDKQLITDEITPGEFKKYFPDGYRLSKNQDKFSLSYTVDLGKYQLFLMDSNMYTIEPSEHAPITQGRYKKETLSWMEDALKKGEQEKKIPIFFSHHNLLPHSKQVHNGFVLNNADAVLDLVKKYHVPLSLSGHTHVQDVLSDEKFPDFYEVTTSAFSISESHIGHLTLGENKITYEAEIFDPRSYFSVEQLKNPELKDYPTYLKEIFLKEGSKMAYDALFRENIYDDNIVDPIAKLSGELNVDYFVGKVYTDKELEELKASEGYQLMMEHAPQLGRFLNKIHHESENNPMSLEIQLKK